MFEELPQRTSCIKAIANHDPDVSHIQLCYDITCGFSSAAVS